MHAFALHRLLANFDCRGSALKSDRCCSNQVSNDDSQHALFPVGAIVSMNGPVHSSKWVGSDDLWRPQSTRLLVQPPRSVKSYRSVVCHPLKKSKIGRVSVCVCLKKGHLKMEVVDWWSNFLTAHVGLFNLGLKGRVSIFFCLTCCCNRADQYTSTQVGHPSWSFSDGDMTFFYLEWVAHERVFRLRKWFMTECRDEARKNFRWGWTKVLRRLSSCYNLLTIDIYNSLLK
jgi:hypothetical protein